MKKFSDLDNLQNQVALEHYPQVAAELSKFPPDARADFLASLSEGPASQVFKFLDPAYQEEVLHLLKQPQVAGLVESLDPDERARLLEQMPIPLARSLLSGLSPAERRMTAELLGYPPDSAGRYMTPEFLTLTPDLRVDEAWAKVRRMGKNVESVYVLPVIAADARYLGLVHLRDLVMSDPETKINEVIDTSLEPILATADREVAARFIQRTDSLAAPIIDVQGRLLGLVTVDDAMDILDRESAEDLIRAGGGAEPLNRPYFSVSIMRLARTRFVWLLALAIAAVLTVNVLKVFEETLEAVITLALFIPLLIDTGGNSGAQSATVLVRAMSVGEVEPTDFWRIVLREAAVGLLLGGMLGLISFVPVWLFAGEKIALVVALTLVSLCCWASAVGAAVPLAAWRLGIDPAVASAPFITTLIDATGLIFYFLIARALLF